jgi:hypothetical protein
VHQLTVLVEVLVAIEMDVQIKEQRDRLQWHPAQAALVLTPALRLWLLN